MTLGGYCILGFLLLWNAQVEAQSIRTVAGGGTDDGRRATEASVGAGDLALDEAGNLYVLDSDQARVRRIAPDTGIISTVAGNGGRGFTGDGGPATAAAIGGGNYYDGIAIDSGGNVLIAANQRIRRVDAKSGTILTIAGNGDRHYSGDGGLATAAGLDPAALAVDRSTSDIYFADTNNHRIRKVTAAGFVSTIAGDGISGFSGDGGPATMARLASPNGLAVGRDGSVYIADTLNNRIRKVTSTGVISTIAGDGSRGYSGDGGASTAASLDSPTRVAVDDAGRVFIADTGSRRIRMVSPAAVISTVAGSEREDGPCFQDGDAATGANLKGAIAVVVDRGGSLFIATIFCRRIARVSLTTGVIAGVAGNGTNAFSGDGAAATMASLADPNDVAVNEAGDVYIADRKNNRVRLISRATGFISTIAGDGSESRGGDGGPATASGVSKPVGVDVDSLGNLYIAEFGPSSIRKVTAGSGLISTVAGNSRGSPDFAGDGGPATAAGFGAWDVAADTLGGLYIGDASNNRIRKVDGVSGTISTIAGDGESGFAGDGGPATQARLSFPWKVAVDHQRNVYVADFANNRVRKVDGDTGSIFTIAGDGRPTLSGDGGPATIASLRTPIAVAVHAGDLYIGDDNRVRRIEGTSGVISTVAGNAVYGFAGDEGPATLASMTVPSGLTVDRAGNLYIADSVNNRVRAVFACRDRLGGFDSSYPGDGAAADVTGLALQWSGAEGAFRYDVLMDESFPPQRVVQRDVTGRGLQLSALQPGKTYYWQIRAKGDPYCEPQVDRMSGIRRFTTPAPCRAPGGPVLVAPPTPGSSTVLSFSLVPNASSYDVYLGTGSSPALFVSGLTSTSYTATGLVPGQTYRWRVVAHATCNPDLGTSSAEGTFIVPGTCDVPSPVSLLWPLRGATGIPSTGSVSWSPGAGVSSYDVYLGTLSDPPLFASSLSATSLWVSLAAGQTYFVRVVARSACDASRSSTSETWSFSTAPSSSCPSPRIPAGLSSTKSTAYLGSTYVLSWAPVEGASLYRVGRTRSSDSSVETITTAGTSLILRASEKTSYVHRVIAVAPCGTDAAPTPPVTVSVSTSPPFITVTNPPKGTVIRQPAAGFPLPRLEVEVRNTGTSDFVGFFNTSQTVPFFIMSETATSLRAGEIRIYYLQFSGVPLDRPGVYEGLLTLQPADPTDTSLFPQVGISLNVTGLKPTDPIPSTTAPQFVQGPTPVDYVRFDPTASGDSPPDILVDLKNPGSTPLDLVADVMPESWISISDASSSSAWNATAIPPNSTRTVRLSAQRIRGGSGGAFPRYAYLTVRTIDGKSSRLLIQDSDATTAGPCPGRSVLRPDETSLIVPSLVNASAKGGGRYVSKLLITNLGTDVAQADLYYTPDTGDPGTSGFDCTKVLFASILIPGLDVVSLTDPVAQLFGIAPPQSSSGQLEIRSSRIGQLRVQSVVDAPAPGGGSFGFQLPTVRSGEGARQNAPYAVIGVLQDAVYRTNLILTETSGEPSSVTVTLYDRTGRALGSSERDLPPYGKKQFPVADLAPSGAALAAGALEITANPGSAGTVAGVITVIDGRTGDASSYLAKPMENVTRSTSYAIPSVVVSGTFKSRVEIRNNDTRPVSYTLRYQGSTGTVESAPRRLDAKAEDAWANVLGEVFALGPTSFGPLFIEADSAALAVVSRVYSEQPTGSYGDAIEGYASDDPAATGAGGGMVVTDGLEGTAGNERTRGARTNLIMAEVGGGAVELEVSIWEKTQRRLAPAGTLSVHLEAHEQKQINDVFGDEGFGIGQKDRLNVLCTVRPRAGSTGRVIALATRIDNVTQDTKNQVLRP